MAGSRREAYNEGMTDRGSSTVWAGLAVVAAVLIIALLQGLTVQEVGIPGIASIKFGEKQNSSNGGSSRQDDPSAISPSATGGSSEETSSNGSEVVEGSWTGSRGDVLVEVTQVESQNGHLRILASVTNGTGDAITIPLFGNATAVDESGRSYAAAPFDSDWPQTVASGQTVNGMIEFEGRYQPGGGTLDLNFAILHGFDAPSGSLTVADIARP